MKRTLLAGSVGAAALAVVLTGLPSTPASALPMPVTTAQSIAGDAPLANVGYWGRRYHRGYGGAIAAGAALG